MTYEDCLNFLYKQLPMYQRVGKVAYKKDLDNTLDLLEHCGNPHKQLKTVHIAGTNGKGTSAHAIASILQEAGLKTGLYTSPHLTRFTERIRINGKEVSEEFVIDFVDRIGPVLERIKPSFFELTVVMAFDYFAKQGVDIAVIETGLGGRLDSTNVIVPEISLITNIGLDHTDLLGDTLSKIAFEKAGIIKPGIPVVIGEYQPETFAVFKDKALVTGSPLVCSGRRYDIMRTNLSDELMVRYHIKEKANEKSRDIKTDLLPAYFQNNIPGILDTITGLQNQGWPISEEVIRRGFKKISKNTGLKGRFQILSRNPTLIADVSHNAEGIRELMLQIKEIPKEKLYLVFGTVIDKDLDPIIRELPKNATYYLTQSSVPRSLKVEKLVSIFHEYGFDAVGISNVNEAIKQVSSLANSHDMALVFGSTFVIGEIDQL